MSLLQSNLKWGIRQPGWRAGSVPLCLGLKIEISTDKTSLTTQHISTNSHHIWHKLHSYKHFLLRLTPYYSKLEQNLRSNNPIRLLSFLPPDQSARATGASSCTLIYKSQVKYSIWLQSKHSWIFCMQHCKQQGEPRHEKSYPSIALLLVHKPKQILQTLHMHGTLGLWVPTSHAVAPNLQPRIAEIC